MDDFDLIVIGAGPGGYVCAIRAAQLGLKTAIVEKSNFGGTCLNIGCIPSKFLLNAAKIYDHHKRGYDHIGISTSEAKIDLTKLQAAKAKNIAISRKGIDGLLKKNKIKSFLGQAYLFGKDSQGLIQVEVVAEKETFKLLAKKVVIATGSYPISLPKIKIDEKKIISSTGALEIDKVPNKLVIIGAGVIGLELGQVWMNLGAKVEVIEALPRAIANLDLESVKALVNSLMKQGMNFIFDSLVEKIKINNKGKIALTYTKAGKTEVILADKILVAIGRKAYTAGINLAKLKIVTDEKGFIKTDQNFKTNIDDIYAIGDVIGGAMLAHKAEEEGYAVAEHLANKPFYINHANIPSVVYTSPELAFTGQSEEELKAKGIAYRAAKFPFMANGKARATFETEGFVKLIVSKESGILLGAGIVGQDASNMIAELVLAIEFGAHYKDLYLTSHAHPSLSEAVKEAALALGDGAIHI